MAKKTDFSDMGCGLMLLVLLLALALIAGFSAFCGWCFMLVWNFAAVETFGAPVLDFYHAWGIWVLITFVGGAFRSATSSSKKD